MVATYEEEKIMTSCYLTFDGPKTLREEAATLLDRRQEAESCLFRGPTKYVMQGILYYLSQAY